MMNNRKRLYITIAFTGIYTLVGILINFFLTPFITNNIGIDAYGYVTLSRTFISYIIILTTALNSFAARYIAISYNNNEYEKYRIYCSSVFYANLGIVIILFIISIIFIFFADQIIVIPNNLIVEVKLLFALVFFAFSISLISIVFLTTAYVKNRLDIANIIKVIAFLIEALVLLALFSVFKPKLWYVGIGTVVTNLITIIGAITLTNKLTPEFKLDYRQFSFKHVKELVIYGIWSSFNSLGNTMNSGLDMLISNLMLTPLGMGQIAIAKNINTIMSAAMSTMSTPFQPTFLSYYSKENIVGLVKEMKLSMRLSGITINLIFALFVTYGMEFYSLWIPGQDINLIYKLTVITLVTSISEGTIRPLHYIYILTLKNRVPSIITILGGVINVIGMYLLLKYTSLGVYSIVVTTFVVMSIINNITNPIYICRCLKIKYWVVYSQLLRNLLSCVLMIIVFLQIKKILWAANSWIYLIMACVVCSIIGILIGVHMILGVKNTKNTYVRWLRRFNRNK